MSSPQLSALIVVVGLFCLGAYVVGMLLGKRGEPLRDWLSMRTRHRRSRAVVEVPGGRPIEEIAADLRRLGGRFHALPATASFSKVEAFRGAYDRCLVECCTSLGLTHLLGVLPPGPQLDAERERVEDLLTDSGVRLPFAA